MIKHKKWTQIRYLSHIGLYSCYAVKRADCQVYAFEPSVFNFELLAKNIYLNSLSDKIAIISLPLFDSLAVRPPEIRKNI